MRWILLSAMLAFVTAARAQETVAESNPDATPIPSEQNDESDWREGIWPSSKLMDLLLIRWSERISEEYGLNERQYTTVREMMVEQWGRYLRENRPTLQPLFNELLEMRLGLEPPAPQQVSAWAERAAPVLEQLRDQIEKSKSQMRKILTPAQRAKFELHAAQLGAGMKLAEQRLKAWRAGRYELREVWQPTRGFQHEATQTDGRGALKGEDSQRRERRRALAAADEPVKTADAEPADQIALELNAWDRYAAEFIDAHQLDEGQRDAVLSVLEELKRRAADHRDRRREQIEGMERRIASFSGDERELTEIETELTELYGPIDEMFKELKYRIEQVPTVQQRARAVARRQQDTPASEDAPGP